VNLLDKKCGLWAAVVLRCRAAHLLPAGTVAIVSLAAAAPAFAQGSAVMTGTVLDTATKRPLADVVVTVTSPALQGEQTVVTDKSGSYRIPNLPPGPYTLRLEGDGYKPYSRGGITMTLNSTIRVNAELLPEGIKAEEVVVVGKAPTVDVGSSSTGVTLNQDFVNRIALSPPGGKGASTRSFESLAGVAPGAQSDTYGVSISGTTSPENAFIIDGVSVNDPAYGVLGTPLSMEFVKELGVITGGYLPEYGKAIGGIFDVVTKSGSNEFHGSLFFNITPGAIEGPRTQVKSAGSVISVTPGLSSLRDFGAEVGGPIIKDKLWFYAGVQAGFSRYRLERNLSEFKYVPDPMHAGGMMQQIGSDTFPVTTPLTCPAGTVCKAGTPASPTAFADDTTIQYIGKLTYLINQDHNITLSVLGAPTRSGGNGTYSLYNLGGPPGQPQASLDGPYKTVGQSYIGDSNDISLKYSGAFNNKRQLFDLTLGWHHQRTANLPVDGTAPGTSTGLAGVPGVVFRRSDPDRHAITDFERLPPGVAKGACTPVMVFNADAGMNVPVTPCPVDIYYLGGPGFTDDSKIDSYQGKAVFTNLVQAAGHHVIKAGVEISLGSYNHLKAYTGGDLYRENGGGTNYNDFRQYGFLTAPDKPILLKSYTAHTSTTSIGGFLQDSWQIFDKVTLNIGIRYDAQIIYGADGQVGLTLPNQWSPRIGVIYDFTQQGRSKLFANYARYYEGVPLDMADRSFPSEPQVNSRHHASQPGAPACNPLDPKDFKAGGSCTTDAQRFGNPAFGNSTNNPSQVWNRTGGSKEPVDPDLSPQSSDEFVVGGEYEVFPDARVGVTYTHRYLNKAIEDMSRDEANTYFIGNPGYGIAKDFPKAVRNYDAMTLYFNKTYSNTWLVTTSYTLSRLYGNYAGLFRPETGQLDPNINSDFDLRSLLPNRMGPLPADRTHQLKIYGAKDFLLPGGQDILIGLTFKTRSGAPLNYLGSHPIYGSGEVYVLPRGEAGRGDWIHTFDARLGYSVRLNKNAQLGVTMDVFNLFNFQGAVGRDPEYTRSDVLPCAAGGKLPACVKHSDGTPFVEATDKNPNFLKPTVYQEPRTFRFGAKITF
jgi:outer membrane receptor protein involved in Fe transport